jgi:hypothetical protein
VALLTGKKNKKIPFAGGAMPVHSFTIVECEFRSGIRRVGPAASFFWGHGDKRREEFDVVAYEVVG